MPTTKNIGLKDYQDLFNKVEDIRYEYLPPTYPPQEPTKYDAQMQEQLRLLMGLQQKKPDDKQTKLAALGKEIMNDILPFGLVDEIQLTPAQFKAVTALIDSNGNVGMKFNNEFQWEVTYSWRGVPIKRIGGDEFKTLKFKGATFKFGQHK